MRSKVSTEKHILSVASNIIKTKGLKYCTMREISKNANIALGTLYNYFSSQDELYIKLFTYSWENTLTKLEQIQGSTLENKIINFFNTLRNEVISRGGLGRMLFKNVVDLRTTEAAEFLDKLIHSLLVIIKESNKHKNKKNQELIMLSRMLLFSAFDCIEYDLEFDILLPLIEEIVI